MPKYIVQINMAEFGEPDLWQDVAGAEFTTVTHTLAHIAWMKKEYGDQINYTFRTETVKDSK